MLATFPRFGDAWRRFLYLIGGESPPLRAVPELNATVQMSPADFELWALIGWKAYQCRTGVGGGGAGNNSKFKLSIPLTAPGMMVEVLSLICSAPATTIFGAGIVADSTPLGLTGEARTRDQRYTNAAVAVASHESATLGLPAFNFYVASRAALANTSVEMLTGCPLIIRPGRSLVVWNGTADAEFTVNIVWRERALNPNEQAL